MSTNLAAPDRPAAEPLAIEFIETPLGRLALAVSAEGVLRRLDWEERAPWVARGLLAIDPGGHSSTLRAYFAGDVAALAGLRAEGLGTPFQRRVWGALREIPAGETRSYGWLAARIGVPRASRAVGAANGANPISLVVPCHRAIGSNGELTGYAGGLERKRWLLAHEARFAGSQRTFFAFNG